MAGSVGQRIPVSQATLKITQDLRVSRVLVAWCIRQGYPGITRDILVECWLSRDIPGYPSFTRASGGRVHFVKMVLGHIPQVASAIWHALHPCTAQTPIPHTRMLSRRSHPDSSLRDSAECCSAQQVSTPFGNLPCLGTPAHLASCWQSTGSASLVGNHWSAGWCLQ